VSKYFLPASDSRACGLLQSHFSCMHLSLVVDRRPPTIKKQQKWLVVTAHCAEYLVMLDEAIGAAGIDLSSSGVDAFYRVDFSDSKVSSNVVTVKGKSRHMLNPEWHFELWIPILVPTATDKVRGTAVT